VVSHRTCHAADAFSGDMSFFFIVQSLSAIACHQSEGLHSVAISVARLPSVRHPRPEKLAGATIISG